MSLAKTSSRTRSLAEIHLAVMLFGRAGLFAKFVTVEPTIIALGRTVFASLALLLIMSLRRERLALDLPGDYLRLALMGALLAVHWTTFFQSIRVSSVAVGLIAYSTFPLFAAFIEPWMSGERVKARDLFVAGIAVLGALLVLPSFDLADNITQGVAWGLVSAASFALLSILNRQYAQRYPSQLITLYQDAAAAVVLMPFLIVSRPVLATGDLASLVVLGVVFTALSHSLFIKGMANIQTRTASIIASLEPVYGIVFALLLLGEVPEARTVLGGVVILGAVAISSARSGSRPLVRSNN